jgi:hypothetical protein
MRDDIAREVVEELRSLTAAILSLGNDLAGLQRLLWGVQESLGTVSAQVTITEPVTVRREDESDGKE